MTPVGILPVMMIPVPDSARLVKGERFFLEAALCEPPQTC